MKLSGKTVLITGSATGIGEAMARLCHAEGANLVIHGKEEEEVRRNINWSLKNLRWDNLFNYGEANEINFENLNGIIGIFGKNFFRGRRL